VTTTIDEVSVLREHLERYRGVTLQTLEFAPEDKLEWRPSEKAMTVAEQFVHIARVEEFYSRGFFGGVWQFELLSQTPDKLTKASLKERLDTGRAYLLEQLGRLEAKRLEEIVKVPNVPVDWPLRGWLWYRARNPSQGATGGIPAAVRGGAAVLRPGVSPRRAPGYPLGTNEEGIGR
jgi:hypothetical protein